MNKIKVFSDSTCDLSAEIINKYSISIIPLYVGFGEDTYKDGKEITVEELFNRVDRNGKLPKTSAPSPVDFHNAFEPFVNEGYDIIYIGLSSLLSSTIQNAKIAASEFPNGRIEVVDSLNLSTGIGLLVMKAIDFIKEDYSVSEISDMLKDLVPKVETAFIIDTLEFLHKGGRCSALQSFVGGMLKIRPIVKVVNGKMILGQKVRGKREKGLKLMLDEVLKDKYNMDLSRIMVTHSMGEKDADFLVSELEKSLNVKEILKTDAGCVISSHCGPNTIGILYIKNR